MGLLCGGLDGGLVARLELITAAVFVDEIRTEGEHC